MTDLAERLQVVVSSLAGLLLWPIVLVLLAAIGHALALLGEALVEGWRRRGRPVHIVDPAAPPEPMRRRLGVALFGEERANDPGASVWLVLDRTEARLARRVDRARTWVRLAPALGLAGTLILLGPALQGLSNNDLQTLSSALVLAFGKTVLGLVAGGLCWVVASHQDRWYRLDLAELRHALERSAP